MIKTTLHKYLYKVRRWISIYCILFIISIIKLNSISIDNGNDPTLIFIREVWSCLSSYYGKCEKILISWVNMSTQRLCKTSLLTKDTLVSRVPSPLSVSKLILSFDVNLILKQLPYFSVSYIYDIFGHFLIFHFHIGKVKMFQLGIIWIFKLLLLFEYFWLGKC